MSDDPAPETTFDIDPADAVAIARLTGQATLLKVQHERAMEALMAVHARVRAKAGLPEGANFGWDETGLKGSFPVKDPPKA